MDNKVSQSTHGGSVDRGNLTTAPDVFVVVQIDKFPADVFSQMLLSRRAGGRLFHTAAHGIQNFAAGWSTSIGQATLRRWIHPVDAASGLRTANEYDLGHLLSVIRVLQRARSDAMDTVPDMGCGL